MLLLALLCWLCLLLSTAAQDGPSNCTGGSMYFSAHPVDSLLYQNPDLFHDVYVYKCVTTVVFTTGSRGVSGGFAESLERGLEAAYARMAGVPTNGTEQRSEAWAETTFEIDRSHVLLRFLKLAPSIQIVYLRLSDGYTDGTGYETSGGVSLKKLYNKEVESITTTDGSATYTLEKLKDLVSGLLKQKSPRDIRVLDYYEPMPEEGEHDGEHADHAVAARLVVDVVKQHEIGGRVLGYACNFMRKLPATLKDTTPDLSAKVGAFLEYAKYDEQMCQTPDGCFNHDPRIKSKNVPGDVKYVATWLDREWYLS